MACERCGCRMVARARGGGSELICADCGHRADPLLHGARMRRAWQGVIALLAMALVAALVLSLSLLQESRRSSPFQGDSGAKEQTE